MAVPVWGETFGDEEYTRTFETFIAGSVEKIQTAEILGQAISVLQNSSDTKADGGTPEILDIGSHDGATIHNVLQRISGIDRVRLVGLDYKPEAAAAFQKRFESSDATLGLQVTDARSAAGDAFSGRIGALLGLEKRSVDYALISHVLYSVDVSDVTTLLGDITDNLLSAGGIAFFVHVRNEGSTLVALRNQYGDRAERDIKAGHDKVLCAPTAIEAAAEAGGYPLQSIAYPVKTYFEKMTDAEWSMIEAATDFDKLSVPPHVARNIARIAFVPLRTPPAMVRDGGSWSALTKKVRHYVQNTETTGSGGYLRDIVVLQFVLSSEEAAVQERWNDVARAVQSLRSAMMDIQEAAESSLLSRLA